MTFIRFSPFSPPLFLFSIVFFPRSMLHSFSRYISKCTVFAHFSPISAHFFTVFTQNSLFSSKKHLKITLLDDIHSFLPPFPLNFSLFSAEPVPHEPAVALNLGHAQPVLVPVGTRGAPHVSGVENKGFLR
jgi:hypothetical protein